MGLVRDVSPFHLRDLNFGDGLAGCFVFGLLGFCLCFLLFGCFVWVASPTCEIFYFF